MPENSLDAAYRAARCDRERFRALAAEHRVATLRGRLIEAADMQRAAALVAEVAREVLGRWVDAARHQVGTDPDDAERWLRRTGRDALNSICNEIRTARGGA